MIPISGNGLCLSLTLFPSISANALSGESVMSGPRCPTMYEPAMVDEAEAADISSGLSTASHCGSAGARTRVLLDDDPRQSGWATPGALATAGENPVPRDAWPPASPVAAASVSPAIPAMLA